MFNVGVIYCVHIDIQLDIDIIYICVAKCRYRRNHMVCG